MFMGVSTVSQMHVHRAKSLDLTTAIDRQAGLRSVGRSIDVNQKPWCRNSTVFPQMTIILIARWSVQI